MVYGEVPPEAVMTTLPLDPPLQVGWVIEDAVPLITGGAAILALAFAVPAVLSVTVTE